jgi:hypothetical protein
MDPMGKKRRGDAGDTKREYTVHDMRSFSMGLSLLDAVQYTCRKLDAQRKIMLFFEVGDIQ